MTNSVFDELRPLARRLQSDGYSTEHRIELTLDRIGRLNPRVNALQEVLTKQSLKEARRVDRLIQSGRNPGPLAGAPIAVKEIIDTTPAVCSAGMDFLSDYRPEQDAPVVRRLRQAGAIIIGMATSDPGAFGVRTIATHHPQAPDVTVGGSSGGSGAALAADFCVSALGTDTGGSIRIPAACCAVSGFKPTRGRVPTQGVRPLVWSLDHVGPMARSVADLADVQQTLDSRFRNTRRGDPTDFVVGYDPHYYDDADNAVTQGMEAALKACREIGAEVRQVTLPDPDEVLDIHLIIFCAESAAYYHTNFPNHRNRYPETAKVLIDLAEEHTGYQYVQAMRERVSITRRVGSVFDTVDVVIAPTLPILPPARTAEEVTVGGRSMEFTVAMVRYTCLFDHTGNPVVATPSALFGKGIASGIQIIGRANQDADVLSFSEKIEAALKLDINYEISQVGTSASPENE